MKRAIPDAPRRRPDRTLDHTLSRNVTIAGVTLGCLCVIAAGVALLGRDRDAGSLPNYVSSRKALKIAWAEPEQQAQFERNPMLAASSPSSKSRPKAQLTRSKDDATLKTASRFDTTFDQLAVNAPAIPPGQVPLPNARPRKLMVAKIPTPRDRVVAEAAPAAPALEQVAAVEAPEISPPEISVAPNADSPSPRTQGEERAARAMTLMSYAPATREQLFAPEVTGSIGNPLRGLVDKPGSLPASPDLPLPAKLPHDKSSALKTKISPEPPLKLTKPRHKMTVQEKLWAPVQVASVGPIAGIGPDGLGRDKNGIPAAPYDRKTAVYVITDKKVYLPDGTELEAHSGYGPYMDDPAHAHRRMRGVTPPHVYNLRMREALFHGVEAIRMLPIGGDDAVFGRDGFLTHSYLLGRTGQSHGCVSFKDYDTFLEAFKDGKINRLAVIGKLD